jgi:hypothetical protein
MELDFVVLGKISQAQEERYHVFFCSPMQNLGKGVVLVFFFFFKDMKIEVRLFWGSGTNQRREGDKNILMYIVCMVGKYDNEIL